MEVKSITKNQYVYRSEVGVNNIGGGSNGCPGGNTGWEDWKYEA